MKPENEENRRKFKKLLYDILKSKGVESEIGLDDRYYNALIFRIAVGDYEVTAKWVMSAEFFDMMRKFNIEVIVLEYGDKTERAVVQMRDGTIKDRLLYAKSLKDLAESLEMKIRVYCTGELFDSMNIEGKENIEVEAFLALSGTDDLKNRLQELGFVSCIVRDDRFTSNLL